MSRAAEQLREAFDARLSEVEGGAFYARIKDISTKDRTCTVTHGDVTYGEVLLYTVENSTLKGFCLIPKVGSMVLVSRVGGSERLYVAMFSELDELLLTISDTELTVSDDGFSFIRQKSGLKKTLSDLCEALSKLTVTTGVGPSGLPINAADFVKIKQDLDNYLKK